MKQQADNDVERERLHALIARLEGHASQQGRQLQQDRWLLQQDTGRLRAQQSAFEEERATALRRLADEGEQLQQAKVGGGGFIGKEEQNDANLSFIAPSTVE